MTKNGRVLRLFGRFGIISGLVGIGGVSASCFGQLNSSSDSQGYFSVTLAMQNSSLFRGIDRIDSPSVTSWQVSAAASGASAAFTWNSDPELKQAFAKAFAGYHYPFGFVDLGTGLEWNWAKADGRSNPLEARFELIAEPLWLGLAPKLAYSYQLHESARSYGELGVSREFIVTPRRLVVAPYCILGFGDFNSGTFQSDHIEAGADVSLMLDPQWGVGIRLAASVPLVGVKRASGGSDPSWFVAVSLTHANAIRASSPTSGDPHFPISTAFTLQTDTTHYFRGVARLGQRAAITSTLEFAAGGWASVLSSTALIGQQRGECSLFTGYYYPLGELGDIGAGFAWNWTQWNRSRDPMESYVEFAADPVFFGIQPTFRVNRQLSDREAVYAEARLARNWALHEGLALAVYTEAAFGDFNTRAHRLDHMAVGMSWFSKITQTVRLGFHIETIFADRNLRRALGSPKAGVNSGLVASFLPGRRHDRSR